MEKRLGVNKTKVDFETKTYELFVWNFNKEECCTKRLLFEINKWDRGKIIAKLIKELNVYLLTKVCWSALKRRRHKIRDFYSRYFEVL